MTSERYWEARVTRDTTVMRGSILRMTSWTHVSIDGNRFTFGTKDRKQVGVFLMLGYEPKDGSAPLDVKAALNEFGWHE